jgi:hypothetical protein
VARVLEQGQHSGKWTLGPGFIGLSQLLGSKSTRKGKLGLPWLETEWVHPRIDLTGCVIFPPLMIC